MFLADVDCELKWNLLSNNRYHPSYVRVKPRFYKQIDLLDCLQKCREDANCKAVDFYHGAKQCWHWSFGIQDPQITSNYYSLQNSGHYDHWEPICEGGKQPFI